MLTLILMTILGSALALGALYIGVMLFGYLLLALGRWQMFEKMGQPGWKGFIPIYSMDHAGKPRFSGSRSSPPPSARLEARIRAVSSSRLPVSSPA